MKIRGVVLGTVEEQIAGGDPQPIAFPEGYQQDDVPVNVDFDYANVVGKARAFVEGGRLLAEITLASGVNPGLLPNGLSFGGNADRVFSIAVAPREQNLNANQPPWEIV